MTRYHGVNVAKGEMAAFTDQFSRRSTPTDLPEMTLEAKNPTALELLKAARPELSNTELRRLIRQGAVSIDGQRVLDHEELIPLPGPRTLRSGPRTFHRIVPTTGS